MGGGGSKASNTIDVAIDDMLSVAATTIMNTADTNPEDNFCGAYLEMLSCCVDYMSTKQTCDVSISSNSLKKAELDLNQDTQIDNIAKQLAEEINTTLNINGKAEAKNVVNLTMGLSQSVKTQIITTCKVDLSGVNSISCIGSNIGNFSVSQSIVLKALSNCSQNSVIIESAKQKLLLYVDQVARAEVEDAITAIIILTAMISALVLFSFTGGPVFLTKLSRISKGLALLLAVGIPLGIAALDCKFTHVMCKGFQSEELLKTVYILMALLVMLVFIMFMRSGTVL